MMIKKKFVVGLFIFSLFFVVAATQVSPTQVFDEFKKIDIKQPGDSGEQPYWWIINNGDQGQYYDYCSDAACVIAEKDKTGNTNEKEKFYARLQLLPDQTPGFYTGAEISELQTGYAYGQPAKWFPTVDHPVTATARIRFSENYHQDGGGGAVGSAGFWLWNSPVDFVEQTVYPMTAFGFFWLETGSVLGSGLETAVLKDTEFVHVDPVTIPIDMTAWTEWKMIWQVDENGQQSIQFFIEDTLVSQTLLTEALPPLSITLWNDVQFATILPGGEFVVEHHTITELQNFDVAYVEVLKE